MFVEHISISSVPQSCLNLCDLMDWGTPGFPVHHQHLELTHSCQLSLWCHPTISSSCHPLLLPSSIFPSMGVCSNESDLHIRWPKYRSFSFSISPSNEYSRIISSRIDWLDLFAVQETLKSLLQHHSSKVSALWLSFLYSLRSIHAYWKNHSFD